MGRLGRKSQPSFLSCGVVRGDRLKSLDSAIVPLSLIVFAPELEDASAPTTKLKQAQWVDHHALVDVDSDCSGRCYYPLRIVPLGFRGSRDRPGERQREFSRRAGLAWAASLGH